MHETNNSPGAGDGYLLLLFGKRRQEHGFRVGMALHPVPSPACSSWDSVGRCGKPMAISHSLREIGVRWSPHRLPALSVYDSISK